MSSPSSLPKGFLLGASTSAYQVEGCWQCDGKGLSIWDQLTNYTYPGMETGNDACKSYPNFHRDVKYLAEAGFNFYRFSISWTRILPDGELTTAKINQAGINYYKNLIKELKHNNIEPVITIYHWDLPQKIQDGFGGWTNPLIVDFMEDYAKLLFDEFGDSVKYWATINEPTLIHAGYEIGETLHFAPAKDLHSPANYIVIHNMLLAHARIYHLYDKKYRPTQKGQIGISLIGTCYRPKDEKSEEDKLAVEEANAFFLGIFANPIFTKEGDYPELVRKIVDENSIKEGRRRSRLPRFTEEERKSLIRSADFFGMNHYMTSYCTRAGKGDGDAVPKKLHYLHRVNNPFTLFVEDVSVTTEQSSKPDPSGFHDILNYVKNNYGNVPVLVTENGIGGTAETDKGLDDQYKVEFYTNFLSALLKAVYEDGCNVIGFTAWSLLDNFEWGSYDSKFGIVQVDFNDPERKRSPKASYTFFKKLIESGHLPVQQ